LLRQLALMIFFDEQAPFSHVKGKQLTLPPSTQDPLPLQVSIPSRVIPSVAHVAALQTAPLA
jgi:hypothetical protein